MAVGKDSARLMVTISSETLKYVENKSKSMGISKAGVIAIALNRMREQDYMVDFLSKIPPDQMQKMLEEQNNVEVK